MQPKITHKTPAQYVTTTWKNGSGTTTELLIDPPSASIHESFNYRISIAQVASSGPFSYFQEHDRIIVLLEGGPLYIQHDDSNSLELIALKAHHFDGAAKTIGTLQGQLAHDFNVFVRKGMYQAHLSVRSKMKGEVEVKQVPMHHSAFIWIFSGQCTARSQSRVYSLCQFESLHVENWHEPIHIESSSDCTFFYVTFYRRDETPSKDLLGGI